jgi:hypothetical protein
LYNITGYRVLYRLGYSIHFPLNRCDARTSSPAPSCSTVVRSAGTAERCLCGENDPKNSYWTWLQACARAPTAPGASTRHPKARLPLASCHGRRLEVHGCGGAPPKRLLRSVDGTLCRARVRGFVLQRRVPCTTTACQTVVGTGATSGALRRIRWRRARVRRHRRAVGCHRRKVPLRAKMTVTMNQQ